MATPVFDSPVLDEREIESISTSMLEDVFADPMLAPESSEAFAHSEEHDSLYDSSPEDGSCLMGFFVAIALQAGAAIGIYCLWLLWQMFR
jgi:hypothetical protein